PPSHDRHTHRSDPAGSRVFKGRTRKERMKGRREELQQLSRRQVQGRLRTGVVFKSTAIDHSAIAPRRKLAGIREISALAISRQSPPREDFIVGRIRRSPCKPGPSARPECHSKCHSTSTFDATLTVCHCIAPHDRAKFGPNPPQNAARALKCHGSVNAK